MLKKSQSSMEYLLLVGIAMALIIPLTIIYISYSATAEDTIISEHINKIGTTIVNSAQEVYYHGKPSKTTLEINFPKNIDNIIISKNEINFRIKTDAGISDMEFFSEANLQGSIDEKEGMHIISIESRGDYVWISG